VWLACCNPEHEEKASSKTAAREKECILARNSITVLTKNQEKLIRSLSIRKNRKKTGLFVAEGMKLVTDFLNSGLVAENIFVVDSNDAHEITGPIEWISEAEMKRITFLETPSPVLAVFEVPQAEDLDWAGMVLVLDRLQDPGNVGTLLRTALWYGITNVVALTGTADLLVAKGGAEQHECFGAREGARDGRRRLFKCSKGGRGPISHCGHGWNACARI
jgi:hypothetical protein